MQSKCSHNPSQYLLPVIIVAIVVAVAAVIVITRVPLIITIGSFLVANGITIVIAIIVIAIIRIIIVRIDNGVMEVLYRIRVRLVRGGGVR